jgi:hypothetical protein
MSTDTSEREDDGYYHPASEGELAALVRHAYAEGLEVRVRGAATGVRHRRAQGAAGGDAHRRRVHEPGELQPSPRRGARDHRHRRPRGRVFMPHWLDRHDPKQGLETIWRTMETLAEWAGTWGAVAIGTDFDGLTDPPDDLDGYHKLPTIVSLLRQRLSQADADAVLGGNARRVLRLGWR